MQQHLQPETQDEVGEDARAAQAPRDDRASRDEDSSSVDAPAGAVASSVQDPSSKLGLWLRIGLAALAAAHGAVWWRALAWWPQLPDQIPIHFNAAGEPDRFVERAIASWFLLPAIMFGICALLGGIALWIDRLARDTPMLLNVPRKDLFLKLSFPGRLAVMTPTRILLIWVLVGVNLLGLGIVEGSARISVNGYGTVSIWPVVAFVAFAGALTVWSLHATTRAIERQARLEGPAIKSPATKSPATKSPVIKAPV